MGWRGKTSNDVVILALVRGEGHSIPSELVERIDEGEWERAFKRGEGRRASRLTTQNIETRLRRLEKGDRVEVEQIKTKWGTQMGYRPLEPGEAEQVREGRLHAARPTDEDLELACTLGDAAEVVVECRVMETASGVILGLVKLIAPNGSSEHKFYPDDASWSEVLTKLLAPEVAA